MQQNTGLKEWFVKGSSQWSHCYDGKKWESRQRNGFKWIIFTT